jgi:proteasome lid subunit RPN8/RPN11
MDILIRFPVYQIMLAHAQTALPLEACGLLAGQDNLISHIYIIENALGSPVAFEMDAQQQIEAMLHAEAQDLELLAAYHSHPQGPQTPSETDISKAYYPELTQIIVSLHNQSKPRARAFTIVNELVTEIRLLLK